MLMRKDENHRKIILLLLYCAISKFQKHHSLPRRIRVKETRSAKIHFERETKEIRTNKVREFDSNALRLRCEENDFLSKSNPLRFRINLGVESSFRNASETKINTLRADETSNCLSWREVEVRDCAMFLV